MRAKVNFEAIYLVFVFFFLIWASVANLWDHRIKHEFPFAYMASDTFQHQVRADSIKQMGNYKYEAYYICAGYKDCVGFYPPLMYHLDVILSYISGLEIYDVAYLLVFIVIGFSAMIFYLIMRKLNKHIAMIGLPLSLLLFSRGPTTGPGPYALITWGSWPLIFGQFFLICFFWSFSNFDLKNSWIFLAVFLSALALQHQPELAFAVFFVILMIGLWLLKKELNLSKIRNIIIAGVVSFITSVYFLIIFKFTFTKGNVIKWFSVLKTTTTDQTLYLSNFGIIILFIIVGIVLSFFILKKKFSLPIFISLFMMCVGFGNYIGLERHAFKTRCLWPIYLSLFVGISIYYLVKSLTRKWNIIYSFSLAIVLLLVFGGVIKIPKVPYSQRFTSSGIMDKYHWDAFRWIRDNTKEDAKVLFLYGDIYNQDALLRNIFRVPHMVDIKEYISALKNKTIKRNIGIDILGDHHGVYYAYRKSLFDFGFHAEEMGRDYFYNTKRDICNFDYIVLDKVSRQDVLAKYNILIANELLKKEFIRPVFDNGVVMIIKNNNPGEDCIAEETRF